MSTNQPENDLLTFYYSYYKTKNFIKLCLERGASINGTNSKNGKSILTIVVEDYIKGCGSLDIIYYLLDQGADPLLSDNNGDSMLSISTKSVNMQLLRIIVECVDKQNYVITESPLLKLESYVKNFIEKLSISQNRPKYRREFVYSESVSERSTKPCDQNPTNALVALCCTNAFNSQNLKQLIEGGAGINNIFQSTTSFSIYYGKTPLTNLTRCYLETKSEYYKKVLFSRMRIVIRHGGNPYASDFFGNSAISLAYEKGDKKLLKLLMEMHQKPNTKMSIDNIEQARVCELRQETSY